jgi:hypothetical protein
MELDAEGNPVVAFLEGSYSSTRVWVQRWTGTEWRLVSDGALSPEGYIVDVSGLELELDAEGRPYVSWTTNENGSGFVYVRRWTGAAWEPLGTRLAGVSSVTPADSPSLHRDPQGRPVLSFTQGRSWGDSRIHLLRWNGEAWETLGQPLFAGEPDLIERHSTSIAPDGTPMVAWAQRVGKTVLSMGFSQVYVARYVEGQ